MSRRAARVFFSAIAVMFACGGAASTEPAAAIVLKPRKFTYPGMKDFYNMVGWFAVPDSTAAPEVAGYYKLYFVMEELPYPMAAAGGYEFGRLAAIIEPPAAAAAGLDPAANLTRVDIADDYFTYYEACMVPAPNTNQFSAVFGTLRSIIEMSTEKYELDVNAVDLSFSSGTLTVGSKDKLWTSKRVGPGSSSSYVYLWDWQVEYNNGSLAFQVGFWDTDFGPRTWQAAVTDTSVTALSSVARQFHDLKPPGGKLQELSLGGIGFNGTGRYSLIGKVTNWKKSTDGPVPQYTSYTPDRTTMYSYVWNAFAAEPAGTNAVLNPNKIQVTEDDVSMPFRDAQFLSGYSAQSDAATPVFYTFYQQFEPRTMQPGDLDKYTITYWLQPLDANGKPTGAREEIEGPAWEHTIQPNPNSTITTYDQRISPMAATKDKRYVAAQTRNLKRTTSKRDETASGAVTNTEQQLNILVLDPATKTMAQTASVQLKYEEGDYLSGTKLLVTGDELLIYYRIWKKKSSKVEPYVVKTRLSDILP